MKHLPQERGTARFGWEERRAFNQKVSNQKPDILDSKFHSLSTPPTKLLSCMGFFWSVCLWTLPYSTPNILHIRWSLKTDCVTPSTQIPLFLFIPICFVECFPKVWQTLGGTSSLEIILRQHCPAQRSRCLPLSQTTPCSILARGLPYPLEGSWYLIFHKPEACVLHVPYLVSAELTYSHVCLSTVFSITASRAPERLKAIFSQIFPDSCMHSRGSELRTASRVWPLENPTAITTVRTHWCRIKCSRNQVLSERQKFLLQSVFGEGWPRECERDTRLWQSPVSTRREAHHQVAEGTTWTEYPHSCMCFVWGGDRVD